MAVNTSRYHVPCMQEKVANYAKTVRNILAMTLNVQVLAAVNNYNLKNLIENQQFYNSIDTF